MRKQLILSFHVKRGVGHTKRRNEHIDNGYHENADYSKIIYSICLANVRFIFHIVTTVPNESNPDGHLQNDAHRYERQTGIVIWMTIVRLEHVSQLICVRRQQCQIHHTLGQCFFVLIHIYVRQQR